MGQRVLCVVLSIGLLFAPTAGATRAAGIASCASTYCASSSGGGDGNDGLSQEAPFIRWETGSFSPRFLSTAYRLKRTCPLVTIAVATTLEDTRQNCVWKGALQD